MADNLPPVDQDRLDKALAELDNWYENALKNGGGFKSDAERQAYVDSLGDMEKHPMFATKTEDLEGNPLVDAIRAIKEEDKNNTELAIMYKDEGNEFMKIKVEDDATSSLLKKKQKNMHEAYNCYTHAMKFLEQEIVDLYYQQNPLPPSNTTTKKTLDRSIIYQNVNLLSLEQRQLFSQLYSNRAAASLTIQNYGQVKQDCTTAIQIWKENIKAYVRKSKALFSLKQYQYCAEFTHLALDIFTTAHPTNNTTTATVTSSLTEIQKQLDEIRSYYDKSATILSEQRLKLQKVYDSNWKLLLNKWLQTFHLAKTLGIKLSYFNHTPPEPLQLKNVWPQYQGKLPLLPPISAKTSRALLGESELVNITWPLLCLYPQYNQLDIIPDANITNMVAEYLAMMFPEPEEGEEKNKNQISWDEHNEYYISNLVVYLSITLTNYSIDDELEWLITCLEYYNLIVNSGGALDMLKYALKDLSSKPENKATVTSMLSNQTNREKTDRLTFNSSYSKYFHPSTIDELTSEEVQQIAHVTEENMQSFATKKSQELAPSSSKTKFSSQFYYEVHLGCSIYSILKALSQYQGLSRGILSLVIFPRNSKAHQIFLQKNQKDGVPIIPLNP